MENSGTHEQKDSGSWQPPTSATTQHRGKRVAIYFGIAVVAVLTWRVFVLLTRPMTLAPILIARFQAGTTA